MRNKVTRALVFENPLFFFFVFLGLLRRENASCWFVGQIILGEGILLIE